MTRPGRWAARLRNSIALATSVVALVVQPFVAQVAEAASARAGIQVAAADQALNTGTLEASGNLTIDAGTFVDQRTVHRTNDGTDLAPGGNVIAGGDLTIATRGDLDILAGHLNADGGLTLRTGGNLNILSVALQDTNQFKDNGVTYTFSQVNNIGSDVSAGGQLSLIAGGDATLQASHLGGNGVTITTPGTLKLLAAINQQSESAQGKHDDLLTTTTIDHGFSNQQAAFNAIDSGAGGLHVSAGQVAIDYVSSTVQQTRDSQGNLQTVSTTNQNPAQAIAALAGQPGYGYLAQLANDPNQHVAFNGLTLTDSAWNNDKTQLSQTAVLAIGLVLAVATLPIGAGAVGTALLGASFAGTTAATVVGSAALAFGTSLAEGTLVGAIDGNLDIGSVLINAGVAGLTAGLTAGIDNGLFTSVNPETGKVVTDTIGGALRSGAAISTQTVANTVAEIGLDSAVRAASSSLLHGSDFGQNLVAGLRAGAASQIVGPLLFNEVGGLGPNGSLQEVLLHAGVGGLTGFITNGEKGAEAGALGAAVAELTSPLFDGFSDTTRASLAQVIGSIGSLIVGDTSGSGGAAALNGDLFNRQLHPAETALLNKLIKEHPEDAQKLIEAACYLKHCADGLDSLSPILAESQRLQQAGANNADQIALLRQQTYSVTVPPVCLEGICTEPTTVQVPAFTYSKVDQIADWCSSSTTCVRIEGVGLAIAGGAGVAAATAAGGATCVQTVGAGCIAAVIAGGVSLDILGSSVVQAGT
ncbi:MAG TPA: hemagglutinin repeat-containing protein, partial [Mycobacterium sp.]|nr:hemagglutinin repeat-containing protein [Mycobacterium sp.]